jgi:hypothetical protein
MNERDAALKADALEIAAMREFVAAVPAALAQQTALRWLEVGGAAIVLAARIPDPWFNRVMGLGLAQATTEADLDQIIAACCEVAGSGYWIHRHPLAQPAALDEWLINRGFGLAKRRSWAKLAREREPPPVFATTLQIRVAKAADFNGAAAVACSAFAMASTMTPWLAANYARPNWHVVVAEEHGKIVGTGALYVSDGTGWLGMGGVLQEFRGRNAHRSLLALRIQLALDLGCQLIVTETGEPIGDEPNPSLANILRCGFRKVASRLNYASLRT